MTQEPQDLPLALVDPCPTLPTGDPPVFDGTPQLAHRQRLLLISCILARGLPELNFAINLHQASSPEDLLLFLTIASVLPMSQRNHEHPQLSVHLRRCWILNNRWNN